MTPERLMNALRQSPREILSRFSLFIIDEAHLIAQSGGRGLLLEGLLSLLDASGARLMLLSGVIGNAASLAAWTSAGRCFSPTSGARHDELHVLTATDKIEKSRAGPSSPVAVARRTRPRYDLRAHRAVRPTSATEQHLVTSDSTPIVARLWGTTTSAGRDMITSQRSSSVGQVAALGGAGSLLMVVTQRATERGPGRYGCRAGRTTALAGPR